MKPIIGVPLRCAVDERGKGIEYIFDMVRRSITNNGGEVLAISPVQDIDYYSTKGNEQPLLTDEEKDRIDFWLDVIQGLFIPGGSKFCEYDRYMLKRAIEKHIPILGVCLGMQMMTCMDEDIVLDANDENTSHMSDLSVQYVHKVKIKKNSKLYNIFGKDEIMVNSFHNFHGTENHIFDSVGYSEDGVLEAVELPGDSFCIGVQWHPEKMVEYDTDAKRLMNAFIDEARKRKTILSEKYELVVSK